MFKSPSNSSKIKGPISLNLQIPRPAKQQDRQPQVHQSKVWAPQINYSWRDFIRNTKSYSLKSKPLCRVSKIIQIKLIQEEHSRSNSIRSIKKYQSQLNLEITILKSSLPPPLKVLLRCKVLNPIRRREVLMAQQTHILKLNQQISKPIWWIFYKEEHLRKNWTWSSTRVIRAMALRRDKQTLTSCTKNIFIKNQEVLKTWMLRAK